MADLPEQSLELSGSPLAASRRQKTGSIGMHSYGMNLELHRALDDLSG